MPVRTPLRSRRRLELFRLCREHVDRDHPGMERLDEEISRRSAADAYDVAPVA
jgi:hypothetical protein